MRVFSLAVVGGGAAGITAAINAARKGASVIICEKMPCPGKKILASGNGRCNLLNDRLDESFYNRSAAALVKTVFDRFGKNDIIDFFKDLGLEIYSEEGRIFPATNQSASVLKLLEIELKYLSVSIELDFEVTKIAYLNDLFILVSNDGKRVAARSIVLSGGGKTYPALGTDGGAYRLAAHFGHRVVEPVPAVVPIVVKDPLCHLLQGQRIFAGANSVIDDRLAGVSAGDLLFTKYGLSGTAILDISEEISIAINRDNKKDVTVSVDMVPFMSEDRLSKELKRRVRKTFAARELLFGILPNKFGSALGEGLAAGDTEKLASDLKRRRFKVSGTRGWNEADVTAGGIDIRDVDERTLESKLKKGLYFAGEILDVNGRRGGYNLAWAWASGSVAGREAAHA